MVIIAAIALSSLLLALWLAVRLRRMEQGYRTFLTGRDGASLEGALRRFVEQVCQIEAAQRKLEESQARLQADLRCHVQHVSLIRFNAFRETGGDQSFVMALADAEGNGAVVTSLHSRDVTRIYAKPVARWGSLYPLTSEEQEALRGAQRNGTPGGAARLDKGE